MIRPQQYAARSNNKRSEDVEQAIHVYEAILLVHCGQNLQIVCEIYRYGSQSVIRITTDQNQKWSASQKKWYYHTLPRQSEVVFW